MRILLCVVLFYVVAVKCQFGQQGARLVQELNSIEFDRILGAPLTAVVDAQAQAARTTAEFIDEIGFRITPNGKEVIMVDFSYEQLANNTLKNYTMHLPFLIMAPIPYLEIKEIKIQLQVTLQSTETQSSSSSTSWYHNTSGGGGGWWRPRSHWSCGSSGSSSTKTTGEVSRKFDLKVLFKAGQAEIPRGTERVLELFENIIREDVPVTTTP